MDRLDDMTKTKRLSSTIIVMRSLIFVCCIEYGVDAAGSFSGKEALEMNETFHWCEVSRRIPGVDDVFCDLIGRDEEFGPNDVRT